MISFRSLNDETMDSLVTINGLSKFYGNIRALDQFTIQIPRGAAFGILGPNGSGKTTLLGMLLGITRPNAGGFEWHLKNHPHAPRKSIGALLETPNFYPYLNAVQNLKITAAIKESDGKEIDDLLKLVGLYERRHSKFATFSLGMKQRLAIAAAMIGDPEVLIFDEPTNGLDPEGIAEVRALIQRIAAMGKTIIMASHILDEVEKICANVAIIRKGQLLQTGTVGSILQENIVNVEVGCQDIHRLHQVLKDQPSISEIQSLNGFLVLTVEGTFGAEDINRLAFENNITLSHLVIKKRRLEEEFLNIIRNSN